MFSTVEEAGTPQIDWVVKALLLASIRGQDRCEPLPNIARQIMSRSWPIVAGAVLFAVGAIGTAIWLWVKRRQLALAAAKAVPGQAATAATEEASAVASAVPEEASAVTDAIPEQPLSARKGLNL
jgi:hypothetical protein